jgi:serine protease AprX
MNRTTRIRAIGVLVGGLVVGTTMGAPGAFAGKKDQAGSNSVATTAAVDPTTTIATPTTTASPTTTVAPPTTTVKPTTTLPSTTTKTTVPTTVAKAAASVSIADYANDSGSLHKITEQIRADQMWERGATGAGVDIAVIDTGVSPVPGLAGKIINGPDISLDVPFSAYPGLDAYGHGTHVASIAAGLDSGTGQLTDDKRFVGVAPGSRIVNVKVGAYDGATDVSQVIAAINWVVQHKNDNGMNIKVINLSFGAMSTNSSADDPLSWAAEVAWRNGISVVASAGNDGPGSKVASPAYNPRIIAVGSVDQGVAPLTSSAFTSAAGWRQPDMWAPGARVMGLRDPGSFIDTHYPSAAVGSRLFRGSGTSQAAAVVSGAVALLAGAYPGSSPDQIKMALIFSGQDVSGTFTNFIQVDKAADLLAKWGPAKESLNTVFGTPGRGSLEATRGGSHLSFNGVLLDGERDIFGNKWDGAAFATATFNRTSWTGGAFNGANWAGAGWAGAGWAGAGWAGAGWAGAGWAGANWAGAGWAGANWAGAGWAGAGWAGANWAGAGWAGANWAGANWAGSGWKSYGWRGAVWG